jgi:glycosyltransferase involved in cell wall biosynthesis
MKSKKILYIGNNHLKNLTSLDNLSFFLRKEGFHVTVTSEKPNKILRFLDMCFAIYNLRGKIDYILIDTYSTVNFYYAFACSQMARFFKIKYIPILHGGNLPKRIEGSPKMANLIFKNSFKNVSPSVYLKNAFERNGYEVMVIPNSIPLENYPFFERKNIGPKLLFVRAFAEIYNPLMAIEVLYALKRVYPKAILCMIGPDRDGTLPAVVRLIEKYKLSDSVEITGRLSKEKWHEKSKELDIFINTTNVDNTPVSVTEAMALGLPIVSTNVGGIPYLIDDPLTGLLVEKNDVENMVASVISLIKGNHKNIATNARKKAKSFSWELVKRQWIKILSE